MLYTVNLDNDNFILSVAHTSNDNTELDLESMDLDFLNAYQLINGQCVLNQEKKEEIIAEREAEDTKVLVESLHKQLDDTDYKIIKCSEYQLAGLELPYDIVELHQQRQQLRDEINKYEN